MQLALQGKSGTVVGLDYRGEKVIAAYEPVKGLNLGIVAKIDLTTERAPFLKAGFIAFLSTIVVVLIGAALFIKISNPIIEHLEKRTIELKQLNDELIKEMFKSNQAEIAIRESEKKYRSLFTNMKNGFAYCKILLDDNNQVDGFIYLEVNNAFEKITGLKRQDVLNKKVTEVIPGTKEQHPELFEIYGKVALTGEGTSFTLDFEPLDLSLYISVYSPQREYFVVIFEDISDKMAAEKTIQKSNEMLAKIFDTTHFSIVYLDKHFNFIRVNKAYADACGDDRDFFPEKNHFDLYPHKENEMIFRNVVNTGEPFTIYAKPFEFPDHPEWGVTYWDWTLHPIKDNRTPDLEDFDLILGLIEESTSESQDISKGIHPMNFENADLIVSLEDLAKKIEKTSNMKILIKSQGQIDIRDSQALTHIYYIVNEAINNSIKHGKAKHIIVNLDFSEKEPNLRIEDNGTGLDMGAIVDLDIKGMGLKTMKYRAGLIGADFSAGNSDKKGFVIDLTMKKENLQSFL